MLKQLMLRKKLEAEKSKLIALDERSTLLDERSEAVAVAIEEASTDEEMMIVNDEVEAITSEEGVITGERMTIETEINAIEVELAAVDARAKDATGVKSRGKQDHTERGGENMHRLQIRRMLETGEYYERGDVKEFYEGLKNVRAVTGEGLTVPAVVVNRIMDIVGDYTTAYPLVDKIRITGTARILVDTDTGAATWLEMKGAIPTGNIGEIKNVDFDGFKVGKGVFVDNSIMQDSIVNLDDYVSKKIARSIAKALDASIISGKGSANKQPTGIIPSLSATHLVDVVATGWKDLVKPIGLIDDGSDTIGEITAMMKRSTYYNRCLEYSIHTDSKGNDVGKLPNLKTPDLLGLTVVFNNNIPEDKILYGDFEQYTMVERESITIDSSDQVKFMEDQTAFRGKGRFDGKPTNADAFVLITIKDSAVDEYPINFIIKKDEDDTLLQGATVNFCGSESISGADGVATFALIGNGKHTYTVTLTGYTLKSGTVTVNGSAREVEVRLGEIV